MAISNNSTGLRPGVCTSSTRPTAPYEGQMIYETDTDLTYVWGGSAWQQISGGTAVGNSGLVFVKSQTVGTGVSSVSVSDAFSATYDNYKIVYTGGTGSTTTSIRMALGSANTEYYMMLTFVAWTSSAYTFLGVNNGAHWTTVGSMDANQTAVNLDVLNPFASKYTMFSGMYVRSDLGGPIFGVQKSTSSFTAFTLTPDSGTLTGGLVTVYGYRK